MNSLQPLRRELRSVRRWRAALNWLTVALRFLLHVGLIWLLVYAADFVGGLSRVTRSIVIVAALGYLLWRLMQFLRPVLALSEGIVDVALLLERQHELPGTLVAGLQLEQASGSALGSQQLTAHVVNDAAACAGKLDGRAIVPRDAFWRQLIRASAVVGLVAIVGLLLPTHTSAFMQRLMLRDVAYPTRTQILSIFVNSQQPEPNVQVVEGDELTFVIRASGSLPNSGRIRIASRTGDDSTSVALTRDQTITEPNDGSATFKARGPKVTADATLSIELGDARANDFRIEVIRRPIVELSVVVTPPEYARQSLVETVEEERYVEALFGSTISFRLRCTNGKKLQYARMELSSNAGDGAAAFQFDASRGSYWVIDGATPPLSSLTEQIDFSLVFEDEDDLSALQPIKGVICVRPDQAPGGSVRTNYHLVLPRAKPVIRYEASDDFGISAMSLEVSRNRNGDETAETTVQLPLETGEVRVAGEVAIDLSQIELRDGDRISARLVVADGRGELPTESFTSEPVEIEIGNEAKVLKAILDADATAERLLNEAIEEEVGLKNVNEG